MPIRHQIAHRGRSLPGSSTNAPPFARVGKKEQKGRLHYEGPGEPPGVVAGPRGRFLYVLHDQRSLMGLGELKPAQVSIVDLENCRVDGALLPLGERTRI